jgi:hypothetical protein
MELILSCAVLTFLLLVGLLLVGAFVDFLVTASAPQSGYHGDAFAPEPKPTHIVEFAPDLVVEYDRAA